MEIEYRVIDQDGNCMGVFADEQDAQNLAEMLNAMPNVADGWHVDVAKGAA